MLINTHSKRNMYIPTEKTHISETEGHHAQIPRGGVTHRETEMHRKTDTNQDRHKHQSGGRETHTHKNGRESYGDGEIHRAHCTLR